MSRRRDIGPPDTDKMFSLKIDNITYKTNIESLRKAFEKYGDIGDVYIPRDRYTQESRGFGFVRFYDERDAEDAIDAMDGRILDGRELRVQMAKHPRTIFPKKGGSYNRSGGRDFYRRRSRSRSRGRSWSRSRSRSKSRGKGKGCKRRSRNRSRDKNERDRSKSSSRDRSYSSDK